MDLCSPAGWRYDGPVIDAHCHFGTTRATARMIHAGERHGVTKWMGICRIDEVSSIRKKLGSRAGFSIWIEHKNVSDAKAFIKTNVRIVRLAARRRCHCMKFWYKPEYNERSGLYWDDPRLDPVFETMVEKKLPALVHIGDPDIWWRKRYSDSSKFEAKAFTYRQLTNTLGRYPEMRVLVAHFGGWPENLPFLGELLDRYPQCYLDTSATKWVARELSRRPAEARAFMIRYADRLLFGTDLVAFKQASVEHHCSRYWVHRHLYEKDEVVKSPIEDADAEGPVHVAGLNLPDKVLRKIYYENAVGFFNLDK
jgi:hypothetical protein